MGVCVCVPNLNVDKIKLDEVPKNVGTGETRMLVEKTIDKSR